MRNTIVRIHSPDSDFYKALWQSQAGKYTNSWTHTCTYTNVLSHDLYSEEVVWQGVDDDEDIGKLRLEDGGPVVSPVLTPHYVHLIIS